MINFDIVDLTTGAGIFSKPFDENFINFVDDTEMVNYALELADDVANLDMSSDAYAIKFFHDGVEFENTNANSEFLQLKNGNFIKDEADATEFLLTSFYSFLYSDGADYLQSLEYPPAEVFAITDQELTSVTNEDLLVLEQQTATNENWDVSAVKINDPVNLTMLGEKGQFNIRSLFMNELSNVKLVADLDGKTLELANLEVSPFDDNDFSLKLATESGVYRATDGNKYFVPTERYDDLENFRLEIDDAKYQALNDVETQWVVHFEKGGASDQTEVKKNVMMLTNLAYLLQSEEFDTVLDHYKEIAGKNFYMYPRYQEGSKQGNLNPTKFTEEEISIDFNDPVSRDYFYDVMGVRNDTTGGSVTGTRSSFYFIEQPSTWQGRSMASWNVFPGDLQLGTGLRVTMNANHSDYHQGNIITPVAFHELGHLFGYSHHSSFCTGEAVDTGERVFYSLIQLMGEAGELPYYDELPEYNAQRIGFNGVEKFIYEHGDEFPDLYKYLESIKDQRNATYDAMMPKIKEWENMPTLLRQLMAVTDNSHLIKHIQDREAYAIFANSSKCFYRL